MLKWLRTIDWTALAGSALALAFCVLVIAPLGDVQSQKNEVAGTYSETPQETLQEKAEQTTASWTVILGIFTGVLAFVGIVQGILIFGQVKLGRDEFISSHRPKIRARLLQIRPLQVGQPVTIQCTIANIGDTQASNIQGRFILKADLSPDKAEVNWLAPFSSDKALPAGANAVITVATAAIVERTSWYGVLLNPEERVRIHGQISYEDDRGITRQTGFLRISTSDLNRFRRFKNKDIRKDYDIED